mmetsp:Transcript_26011/g.42655  ORF Transcript_26011/g.42655 Transcript_26011/m.42655 type:complete len:527 (+) Transcript_26011:180-1760(+)|eukprot:CAMPEP_0184660002 /NCGR_PEP_ID=MMETSP0308-20130426/32077_1 /TAXON_ID=38269 /ORGANISM="Gloeochaete witrockiana, Strain SAG 46.84" /LENGTH=526 /DNA_ID=CAMNT_0027100291 /DNA_START=76 /DNA_END=1656 /DNA_ORIENTATION=-
MELSEDDDVIISETPAEDIYPKTGKKRNIAEASATDESDNEEGSTCPICYNEWSQSGEHRICCLKCGHLFGKACILRWLDGKKSAERKCPVCKASAKASDVRDLWVTKLQAVEVDRQDIEHEKKLRVQAEAETAKYRQQADLYKADLVRLKADLAKSVPKASGNSVFSFGASARPAPQRLMTSYTNIAAANPASSVDAVERKYVVSLRLPSDGSRVFDFHPSRSLILLGKSVPSCSLSKISILTQQSETVVAHSNRIRDVKCGPGVGSSELVMTASLDKSLKISSVANNNTVLTYNLDAPVWACEWQDDLTVYCGLANGRLVVFDLRNTSDPLASVPGLKFAPIHNIACGTTSTGSILGPMTASMAGVCLWAQSESFAPRMISSLTGNCSSVYSHPSSRLAVASFRTTPSNQTASHTLFDLQQDGSSRTTQTALGHTSQAILSRSLLFPSSYQPNDEKIYLAAGDETSNALWIWNATTGSIVEKLERHSSAVLDVRQFVDTGSRMNMLGSLSDQELYLYSLSNQHR